MLQRLFVVLFLVAVALAPLALARIAPTKATKVAPDIAQAVRAILAVPEDKIDLARAKLALDKLVDPKINVSASLKQIDLMAKAVRSLAGPNASKAQTLGALRKYIYDSGEWNAQTPFSYDMVDPYGLKIGNKLLPQYLSSHLGNCVSMPTLFVILGDRLGLQMTLAVAPNHLFVKYTEATTGKVYNLEATSGGYPSRDVWYRQNMSMSDEAIRNGVYMRAMTKREALAVMGSVVAEYLMAQGRFAEAVRVTDVLLEFHPTFVAAMVMQGMAAVHQIEAAYQERYPTVQDMPRDVRSNFQNLIEVSSAPYRRAQALGWRETDGQGPAQPSQNLH